jgi:putative solute:sodium symporter small subunit
VRAPKSVQSLPIGGSALPQLNHESAPRWPILGRQAVLRPRFRQRLQRPGSRSMIERNERKPYWRHTKVQMLTSLLPFVLAMIVLPLYAETLNDKRILGIPLGYFLACHGLGIIAFVTIAVFVNRQDAIDRWHGAHEDL